MQVEVTGRWFQVGEDTYISFPLVNRASRQGEPHQPLCTEMLHWDDYRREHNVNDGTPPMEQLFSSPEGEFSARSLLVGKDTCLSQVVVACESAVGAESQPFCTEMLHWDDYCAARNIATGVPTMTSLFRPPEIKTFDVYEMNDQRMKVYVSHSIALTSYGAAQQSFCSEMDHWDCYVQAKTGQPPQPTMASLFR